MESLNEDKIKEYVIDFNELRSKSLDEGIYSAMGSMIKLAIGAMFGFGMFPAKLKIKGTRKEANAFMNTLKSEAKYVKAAKDHGLSNPRTYKSKNKLTASIKGFEKATGLKWPFK
tara:strand:- start:46 stop:390 length:345 start_codon:yes stop_codon:yes gene_type:complete